MHVLSVIQILLFDSVDNEDDDRDEEDKVCLDKTKIDKYSICNYGKNQLTMKDRGGQMMMATECDRIGRWRDVLHNQEQGKKKNLPRWISHENKRLWRVLLPLPFAMLHAVCLATVAKRR